MYEIILKWGLDTLRAAKSGTSDQEFRVMLEAIKTKNQLVTQRFQFAWDAGQDIVDLSVQVEETMSSFDALDTDGSEIAATRLLGSIRSDFHPPHYRQLRKARSRLDATNDILSLYSDVFVDLVHWDTIEEIIRAKDIRGRSGIRRTYRGLWTFYAQTVMRLLRLSASDLRFWLVDSPHIDAAEAFAKSDFNRAVAWLKSSERIGQSFRLQIETPEGLSAFWANELPEH